VSLFDDGVRHHWPDQAQTIFGLIRGSIDPMGFPETKKWAAQCYNRPTGEEIILKAIDEVLGGYGVEGIDPQIAEEDGLDDWVSYVNMGDPYVPTIIYDHDSHLFHVGGWGTFLEFYHTKCEACEGTGRLDGIGSRDIPCDKCEGTGGHREAEGVEWQEYEPPEVTEGDVPW
jgi:hypothetical protein